VGQLTKKVNERKVRDYFETVGKVNDVIMIRDRATDRHKGFAYVEMADLESIPLVLMLNNAPPDFQKFPILVKASEAEKNFVAKQESTEKAKEAAAAGQLTTVVNLAGATGQGLAATLQNKFGPTANRIYVGNLHINITADNLKEVFSQFGQIDGVDLQKDAMGASKGYAFVRFKEVQAAQNALKVDGLELMGRVLKIGPVNETQQSQAGTDLSKGSWKLDDDEGSGVQMSSQSRQSMMQKLAMQHGIDMPQQPPGLGGGLGGPGMPQQPAVDVLSNCIVLKNMFDPVTETGDEWDVEIKEDCEEEGASYGTVLHCYVEKQMPGGLVYMMFSELAGAQKCCQKMSGRWFNKRQVLTEFQPQAFYFKKFPEAKAAFEKHRK